MKRPNLSKHRVTNLCHGTNLRRGTDPALGARKEDGRSPPDSKSTSCGEPGTTAENTEMPLAGISPTGVIDRGPAAVREVRVTRNRVNTVDIGSDMPHRAEITVPDGEPSQGRNRRSRREPSQGRDCHSHRQPSQERDHRSHREPSRGRNERGGSQDELDRIRQEHTRSESKKRWDRRSRSCKRGEETSRKEISCEDGRGDYPWSREISPAKKLNKVAEQKRDSTRKRDRSHGSSGSRSPSHERSSRGRSSGRSSRSTSTETTDLAMPSPEAQRPARYSQTKKKSSARTKFSSKNSDTRSDMSEDSESSECSWDTPFNRRELPPPPPGLCAPASSPLKRRKSIDGCATPRLLDCDRPDNTRALLAMEVPVFSLTEADREFLHEGKPVPRDYIARRDFESELMVFSPDIWIGLTRETILQQQGPPGSVQLCEDRIMASLLPRREWSRNEAQEVAAILKTLPLMLALCHHWEIRIPNPPDLPFLEVVVWDDPDCPRLGLKFRDFRSSMVSAERWVTVIRRILYWLGEAPSGRRLAQQLTMVLNLSEERWNLPITDWNTLVIQQLSIDPNVRRDWQQKQRQAGSEGSPPEHRAEGQDVRQVTLKQVEQTAEAAKSPPRDDSAPRTTSAPRAPPVATEAKDDAMLTIGVDPEEARELLGSPVGSPTDMEVDETVLDG